MVKTKETERRRSYCWIDDDKYPRYSWCQRTRQLPTGTKDEGVYYRVRYCHVGAKGRNFMETERVGPSYETMPEAAKELEANIGPWLGKKCDSRFRAIVIERSADGGRTFRHWLVAAAQCRYLDPYDRQKYL